MRDILISSRYALAAYEEAIGENLLADLKDDIGKLKEMIAKSDDFRILISSEAVDITERIGVINKLAGFYRFCRVTHGLLLVMINNGRLHLLSDVINEISGLILEGAGEVKVIVRYAGVINDTQRSELKTNLVKLTGKTVVLEEEPDSSLLCGLKLMIGNTMYDFSAKGKLDALKSYLLK